jgi:hypothetical protein
MGKFIAFDSERNDSGGAGGIPSLVDPGGSGIDRERRARPESSTCPAVDTRLVRAPRLTVNTGE